MRRLSIVEGRQIALFLMGTLVLFTSVSLLKTPDSTGLEAATKTKTKTKITNDSFYQTHTYFVVPNSYTTQDLNRTESTPETTTTRTTTTTATRTNNTILHQTSYIVAQENSTMQTQVLPQPTTTTLQQQRQDENNNEGNNSSSKNTNTFLLQVEPTDFIYFKDPNHWDSSPIVIESHKLLFFTIAKVGCTVWKQLFRRMMGCVDWKKQELATNLPHNPKYNGLKYLYDYPIKKANEMMTNPEWTRAIMVRDPKIRFLSAFLDKSIRYDKFLVDKCCPNNSCIAGAKTLSGFLDLCKICEDNHWDQQHQRIDAKYSGSINWFGNLDTAEQDAKELLQRIGAWDAYGMSGWGGESEDAPTAIFENKGKAGAGKHAAGSNNKVLEWYTPAVEEAVETHYSGDYDNPLFNFTRGICLTCKTLEEAKQFHMTQIKSKL